MSDQSTQSQQQNAEELNQSQKPQGGDQTSGDQTSGAQSNDAQNSGTPNSGDQLLNELDRLGNQLIDAIRTAWNSDQRKELESEITKGINQAANSLNEGFQKVSASESTKNLLNKAEEVFSSVGDQVRNSKVTHDVVEGLSKGIQGLSDQLAKFTADLKKNQPPPTDESQDIKVEKG